MAIKTTAKKGVGGKATAKAGAGIFEFPSDIIPDTEAELETWKRAWSNAIFRYGSLCLDDNDIENYNHAQGVVDEADFDYLTKMYSNPSSKKVLPVRIPRVNALPRILNDILGRADEHSLSWTVTVVNEEAINAKLEALIDKQTNDITRMIRQTSGVAELLGRPLVEGDDVEPVNEQIVMDRNISNYHQEGEIALSKGLEYLMEKRTNNFRYKFIHQGLYNFLITGKIAFDTFIDLDDPNFNALDSRLMVYDLESESNFIHKGRLSGYYFGISPQEIIDRCPNLDKKEIEDVQAMNQMFKDGELGDKSPHWFKHPTYKSLYFNGMQQYWKGLRKRLVKLVPNAYDEENPHVYFVSEKDKEAWEKKKKKLAEEGKEDTSGVTFTYRYYNVWFECKRLTESIFYQCREMPNQLVDGDSPSEQDGPIVGLVDTLPSIIELTKALDRLRIEAFTTISRLANQAVGKIMIVDESTEEDGVDNIYNMLAFRVYKINTNKDGVVQDPNARRELMPKEVDLGLSEAVTDLIRWIQFIDQNILLVTGLNDPYMGEVKSDQGLGVTQLANQSAQRAIQPYMASFYTCVEQTLQRMLDLMRPAWAGKDINRLWMGDKMAKFFNLPADNDWHTDKYGFYLQNSVADDKKRQYMINMASQLLPIAKDPDLALAVIKMFNSSSSAEADKIFSEGIAAMKKLQAKEMELRQQEMESRNAATMEAAKVRAQSEQAKNDTVLKKTQMEEEGDTHRLTMEIEHNENVGSVSHKNEMGKIIANKVLQT